MLKFLTDTRKSVKFQSIYTRGRVRDKEDKKIGKLIVKIACGKNSALDELFYKTKEQMYFVAYRYLRDKSKIADVLNDSYFKIYRASASYKPSQSARNWMYTIVKNTALTYTRKDIFLAEEELTDVSSFTVSFVDDCIDNINLKNALMQLDKESRNAIVMKFWGGYTFEEIAKELQIPMTTLYGRYKAALKIISKYIKEENA